ncbi:MAG: beta-ketoacyl synthase chain length factor [Gammaproteobacteria bacterium]
MVYVNGVSVIGPGLTDVTLTRSILRGEQHWQHAALPALKPAMLPANERRRTTTLIKLALQAMQGLLRENDDLGAVSSIFASSDGDLEIVDKMCRALARQDKLVSPTVFHNSVHNAPAGYWSIAASLPGASTSISAADATFMVGLMEAMTKVLTDPGVVLYVAYDNPAPEPLFSKRPFAFPLAIALRLGTVAEPGVLGTLTLKGETDKPYTRCRNLSLEPLREGVPPGFGLPLVEALCRRARMEVDLPYLSGKSYAVTVSH